MRTQRLITNALIVSVVACGLVACGDEDVDVDPQPAASQSASSSASSSPATDDGADESAASASQSTSSSQDAAGASSDETLESEPESGGGLETADKNALGGLKAFESQALKMTEVIGDREVSPEFEKISDTVRSEANDALASIDEMAKANKESITAGSPAGLLSEQNVTAAGTPSGAEFEMAWKSLMAKQREAATDWLKSNPSSNPEVQSLIEDERARLESQLQDLQK